MFFRPNFRFREMIEFAAQQMKWSRKTWCEENRLEHFVCNAPRSFSPPAQAWHILLSHMEHWQLQMHSVQPHHSTKGLSGIQRLLVRSFESFPCAETRSFRLRAKQRWRKHLRKQSSSFKKRWQGQRVKQPGTEPEKTWTWWCFLFTIQYSIWRKNVAGRQVVNSPRTFERPSMAHGMIGTRKLTHLTREKKKAQQWMG